MTDLRRFLPWFLFAVSLALTLSSIVLMFLNRDTPGIPDSYAYAEMNPPIAMSFTCVGLLVVLRAHGNAVGWLLLCIGFVAALNSVLTPYTHYGVLTEPGGLPAPKAAAWLLEWTWVPLVGMSTVFLPLLFPDGRLMPSWRPVAFAGVSAVTVASLGVAFTPGPLEEFPALDNPLGGPRALAGVLDTVTILGLLATLFCSGLSAASQFARFRRAASDERHQIKWFAAAAALVAVIFASQISSFLAADDSFFYRTVGKPLEAAFVLSICFIPLAVGIAVLRYRLYDIDIIINRTLVYVPLTAILAGLYVTLTGLFRTVFTEATDAGSDAAIALSTLAVVAVLTPVKNQLQAIVDRNFKETRDPARDLMELSAQAQTVLQVVDNRRFTAAFLSRAVLGFEASGGVVRLTLPHEPDQHHEVGDISAPPALTVPLRINACKVGYLALGPRFGGRPYSDTDRLALTKAAEVLVEVARLRQ